MRRTQKVSVFIRTTLGILSILALYLWYQSQSRSRSVTDHELGEMAVRILGGMFAINLVIYLYSRSTVRSLYEKALERADDEEAREELLRVRKAV